MNNLHDVVVKSGKDQYTLWQILGIWLAAGAPKWLLGWIVAFSAKRFHSNWFPIILHSGQIVFVLFLILGLVLGLA